MKNDLTPRWKDFAVYLPAMQYHYASAVDSNKLIKNRDFPAGIKLTDLDFLNPKVSCGITAMHFTQRVNLLMRAQRHVA
jgi:hypothetical protein